MEDRGSGVVPRHLVSRGGEAYQVAPCHLVRPSPYCEPVDGGTEPYAAIGNVYDVRGLPSQDKLPRDIRPDSRGKGGKLGGGGFYLRNRESMSEAPGGDFRRCRFQRIVLRVSPGFRMQPPPPAEPPGEGETEAPAAARD